MASLVNPSNINGNFPIAGQDNDSQGFRDNFTNIRNNFTFIKAEVEDLQAKAVLKSALTGTALNNDFQGQKVRNLQISNLTETMKDWGQFPGGDLQLDLAEGNVNKIFATPGTNITINSVTRNWPSSLQYVRILLYVTIPDVTVTLTLPVTFITDLSGIPGLRRTDGVPIIRYTDPGDYIYEITSVDSGTTVFMRELTTSAPVFRDPNFYTLGIGVGKEDDSPQRDGYQSPTLILGFGDYLGAGTLKASTGVSYLVDDLKDGNDTLLVKGSISSYQRHGDDTANAANGFDSLTSAGYSVIKDRSTLATAHGEIVLGAIASGDLVGYYNAIGLTYTNNPGTTLGYQQLGSIEFVANGSTSSGFGLGGNLLIKTKGDGTQDNDILGLTSTGVGRGQLRTAAVIDSLQNVQLTRDLRVEQDLTVARDTTVIGNLTVLGATTTISTQTVVVEDKNIVLGDGGSSLDNDGAGITVANTAGASLSWEYAGNSWVVTSNDTAATSTATGALRVAGGLGVSGNIWAGRIDGTPIGEYNRASVNATFVYASDGISTANAQITGGSITGVTGAASTLVATNLSSSNIRVSGGFISASSNIYTTIGYAGSFSSPNVRVTGGFLQSLANVYAGTAQFTNFSSGNIYGTANQANFTLTANAAAYTNNLTVATTAFVRSDGGFTTQFVDSVAGVSKTFAIPAGITKVKAMIFGGGGGGGGNPATAGTAGGGGGSGAFATYFFTGLTPGTNITYAVGNAGTGGVGAIGGAGGASNVVVGGVTVNAPGGAGGAVGTTATVVVAGGAGGAVATQTGGSDTVLNANQGIYGGTSMPSATGTLVAGGGGGSVNGGSGAPVIGVSSNGNPAAAGSGAGGSGSCAAATATARNGGLGGTGRVVFEY
jgi:hypothetical protein